jgi:threonine/homoserine/homoserine lactone efflux protein
VVRNALRGGREAGLASAFGAAVGNTSHAIAAGLGLALVFTRWPVAMTTLRVGGAIYLAWLGLASVYRTVKHVDGGVQLLADESNIDVSDRGRGSFGQGLTVNVLNPAIATFYLIVVPSFLPGGAPRWYFAALAAIHIVMALVCHGLWAVGLAKLRNMFRPPLARRVLEGATGLALLALAARVLFP